MKINKSNYSNRNPRLLLLIPMIFSMAFAACSDVASTPRTHQTVNLQSAVIGHAGTGDSVTIGQRSYSPEARSFDRPWPFGPEGSAQ